MALGVEALSSKNPYYSGRELDWVIMRDAYAGERLIKEKGELYLPPTAQQRNEGMAFRQPGFASYQAYRMRAVYHELVKPALMAMLGVMHRAPPDIELPSQLDKMRDHATFGGESLPWLTQKINEQQMLMGRLGLLLDVADGADAKVLPHVVVYNTEQIINWDSTIISDNHTRETKFVVLNESAFERQPGGLMWQQVERYRVLARAGNVRDIWPDIQAEDDEYVACEVVKRASADGEEFKRPSIAGQTLKTIPFVFVGPRDLAPEPDAPVLMPLARIALTIYRTEADYRQSLYMQGQDTLVVIGQNPSTDTNRTTVGAFGSIDLPINGDAKFIGADSGGISEQATAIQNDLKRAAQLGAQLLSERGNEAEAGQALAIRVASRTATLTTVAQMGAVGLEQMLRQAAIWKGADPDKVHVNPNLDFADDPALAQDTVYLQTAKNMGLPISRRSIHGWLKKREFTPLDYEEEQKEIDKEEVLPGIVPGQPGASGRGVPGDSVSFPKPGEVTPAKKGTSSGSAGPRSSNAGGGSSTR
jgi:hypothetical protein